MRIPACLRSHLTFILVLSAGLVLRPDWCSCQSTSGLDSLLALYDRQDPDAADIDLLCQIAMQYAYVNPVDGVRFARQARDLAARRGLRIDMAKADNAMAANWLMLVEMDSALHYFGEAMAIYEAEGDQMGRADILGNMGHTAYNMGRFDDALRYYFEALELYESLDFQPGVTNQHASLANTYMVQEKYAEALSHNTFAMKGFTALGDSMGQAMVLGNIGNIYSEMKSLDTAAQYYERAVGMYTRLNQPMGLARNLVNVSGLYNDLGRYPAARDKAMEGLAIFRETNFPLGSAYCLSNIGLAYLESYLYRDSMRDDQELIPGSPPRLLNDAIKFLEEAVFLTEKLESPDKFEDAHRALSMAYKLDGQYEKALKHYERFAALKDSIASVERAARIEQLTTQREIAVRDKQIELDKLRLKVKRDERIYFIFGLVLLAGWLTYVYQSYRKQRASNHQLALLNGQVTTANLQLEQQNDRLTQTLDELRSTQAQLIESERQQENEVLRRRISRDIHDDISSGLSKISWMAESLRDLPGTVEPPDPAVLHRISSYARETVSKLGEIIWSTKPESDNMQGLTSYCRDFLNRYLDGIPIQAHIDFPADDHGPGLNPELRRNLYLVMKEAVHNAVKYSGASDLYVSLQATGGTYRMVVEDNGSGMETGPDSPGGNGLRNMRERMAAVRGEMRLETAPGKGTRIEFAGPVY